MTSTSPLKRKREDEQDAHVTKPPTGEQLREIKDAADLYRSSSFKLQIDALLPNVTPKYNLAQPLDALLLALHTVLKDAPSLPVQHPLHASRSLAKEGVAVPYIRPLPTEETNWKVAFHPPTDILLVGSWPTKTAVKAKDSISYHVDLAVAMPPHLFQEKDYLNGRVFQKRAYYLAVLASVLSSPAISLPTPCHLAYTSTDDDPRHTALVLSTDRSFGKLNTRVRIIPFLLLSPIPLQRLSSSRSNIRTGSFHDEDDNLSHQPTPIYNSAVITLTSPKAHLLSLHALIHDVPAFSDALVLLRVWANQRGYGLGNRMCVAGFEGKGVWWFSVLKLLVHGEESPSTTAPLKPTKKRKPLGKGLSSYQLFRAALDYLATSVCHNTVFLDSVSTANLLAGVPSSSLDMLRYDAQVTLEALDHSDLSEDPFRAVFLQDHREPFSRFDVVVRIDVSAASLRDPSPHLIADHGSVYNALMSSLSSTLRLGLGNRAKAIAILHPSSTPRPLAQALPTSPSIIYLGLILDTDHAFRLVDHGPAAEEHETAQTKQFRDFWGDKAELRRFKDGSITESVVWDVKSVDEKAYIPLTITQYLLQRHFGIAHEAIQSWQTPFDALLKTPDSVRSLYMTRSASTGFKAALAAYDGLVRQIKALDQELPLAVLNVSPVSPALRYTEVFVPVALPLSSRAGVPTPASYLPLMEIILEFEKSARWPDDLCAIQKVKLAFLERLASCLIAAVDGLRANVVLGDTAPQRWENLDEAALDIITPQGWAFRARIAHDREATLLAEAVDLPPFARARHARRFVHAPRHHRAIAALCHRFPAFAGTVRLTKRWFAAHWLLRSHVGEEVVELLCAHVFLRTSGARAASASLDSSSSSTLPAGVPGSKERGFAQVVEFLKDWDWTKGVHVPVDHGERDVSGPTDVPSHHAAWSLTTDFDPAGHVWTSSGPNAVVARRVTALAKATWDALGQLESGDMSVQRLFKHPNDDYDFLIELDPAVLPRYYQCLDADPSICTVKGKYANAAPQNAGKSALAGFDPAAAFFDDLKDAYQDSALLFHDVLGGTRIGVVWVPGLTSPRPFKVLGGFSSMPVKEGEKHKEHKDKSSVVLNRDAVAAEIARLGVGLVSKLQIQPTG